MSVKIKCIEKGEKYEVNGKIIYLDSNGSWVTAMELTSNELKSFHNYRKAIIENSDLKTHPKTTYKYLRNGK